jgi:hypothetical protein
MELYAPNFRDTWWAVGQEFRNLPEVDPAFNRQNMGFLRRMLLRTLALPLSYRRSDFQRIVRVGQARAGYLYARRRGESLHIDSLGVAATFQRQGLAQGLLQAAREYAINQRLDYLTAAVTPENLPAQVLFSAAGFRPHRRFRARFEGSDLQTQAQNPGNFHIDELAAMQTLPAYERWKKVVLQASDPWASDLVLDVYLRSGWRGAARHWLCYDGEQELGYVRVAGLTGKFEAYLACAEAYWDSMGQIAWLQQALASYASGLQNLIVETAGDRQFEASRPVWEKAGFTIEPRPRYLLISKLDLPDRE